MLFYIVKIVDALKVDGVPVHRLVEYQTQAPTAAAARVNALEYHLARSDRAGRTVRCVIVDPVPGELRSIVQLSDRLIDAGDLEKLERIHQPYVIA